MNETVQGSIESSHLWQDSPRVILHSFFLLFPFRHENSCLKISSQAAFHLLRETLTREKRPVSHLAASIYVAQPMGVRHLILRKEKLKCQTILRIIVTFYVNENFSISRRVVKL